jgi:hypothetical protein
LSVDNSLADAEDVRPCQIGGAHGHLLCDWIDVRDFVDVGGICSTENRENPLWYRLIARDKTFSSQLEAEVSTKASGDFGVLLEGRMTHNTSAGVDSSRERIYTHDMCRLIIPRTVLAPVRG